MKLFFKITTAFFLVLTILCMVFACHFLYTRSNVYQSYDVKLENVLAFSEKTSFMIGDSIKLKIHSKNECFGQLLKMEDSIRLIVDSIEINEYSQSSIYNPIVGFSWRTNLKICTDSLNSGYYLFKVFEKGNINNQYFHPIIINPIETTSISIIASTNTWQCYNDYGGISNYNDKIRPKYFQKITSLFPSTKPITYCSNQRPFSFMINEKADFEVAHTDNKNTGLINELDTLGKSDYPIISYDSIKLPKQHIFGEQLLITFLENQNVEYGVYSDLDFAYNADIFNSDVIIFHMHSEYWSQEMVGKLEAYCSNGGHVIFASGNNLYREVEFYEKGIKVFDEFDGFLTRSLTGTVYSETTYPINSSYKVNLPNHWVFNDCNLTKGDTICSNGSGWETDKVGYGSSSFKILATGLNQVGPAQMVINEFDNGGWLFNASSMTFTQSIENDNTTKKLILNLIKSAQGSSYDTTTNNIN